ncbi:MAG: hypothetical protein AAF916_02265 [Planctomycetota bacterium]
MTRWNPLSVRVFVFTAGCSVGVACFAGESAWVAPGIDGRLVYESQPDGDRIPDFSAVGYRYGREAIPNNVPVVTTVQPGAGDDTALIQAAINQVAALPLNSDGFRGVVQLGPGEFQVDSSVFIRDSGVVLRGSGQTVGSGTVIRATGTSRRDVIIVEGSGSWDTIGSTERQVLDKVVPVGATSFRVQDASSFSPGDRVIINRPSTAEWISDIGMDQIPPRSDGGTVNQWQPGGFDRRSDRTVTRVEGDRVFFDAPITQALEAQYGGGTVTKYTWTDRIENVGIENLRGVSDFDENDREDEDHARSLIFMNRLEHGWVRDVTAEHFWYSLVEIDTRAKNVTVQDAANLDPISRVTGGRRYAYQNNSQLSLVRDVTAEFGRHDFIHNSPNAGPNVFFNATVTDTLDESGPHQRWTTGGLFDNVTVDGDELNVYNRGNFGTGHGWAGGNFVIWNSSADGFIVQNPPTAQNWVIGSTGQIRESDRFGEQEQGIYDHHGTPVDTTSLYLAQLADRDRFADASYREYVIGDFDDFAFDGPGGVDATPLSTDWFEVAEAGEGGILPVLNMDQQLAQMAVPLTFQFQVDPGEYIAAATVSIALRGVGETGWADELIVERASDRILLADLLDASVLNPNQLEVVTLQFVGESLADFRDGELRLIVRDSVAVDWGRLELIATPGVLGDFDGSGVLDGGDIDALRAAFGAGAMPGDAMNLVTDGVLDEQDVAAWVTRFANTRYGDLDLDGDIDLADATALSANYSGSVGAAGGLTWAQGDLDGDGDVDFADAMRLRNNVDPALAADVAAVLVPEPGAGAALAAIAIGLSARPFKAWSAGVNRR